MIANTTNMMAMPIVNWKIVFSNPRRVRWIESEPEPNAPLNDDPFVCSRITAINTVEMMIVTRLSEMSNGYPFPDGAKPDSARDVRSTMRVG